ncbi:MAG: SUF system Fe-S cluster assembly protein [Rhodospirillaceae bacterium]|nr:SUF system Fe-S cluster assembly protein [Rhodospirillaceae bacterium]|tara:strand:+ start:56 stop:541 length:486 start_codon:yes stop_codon:yes gene_type:complete
MDINSTSDKKQTYTSWTPTETEDISNIENNTNEYNDDNLEEKINLDEVNEFKEKKSESEGTKLETKIIDAIRLVYDPEIPVNIYELGLIYDIDISEKNDVNIQMTLTAPGCPVAGDMPHWVSAAIESNVDEISEVNVEIVWEPPWSTEMMSEAAKLELGYL